MGLCVGCYSETMERDRKIIFRVSFIGWNMFFFWTGCHRANKISWPFSLFLLEYIFRDEVQCLCAFIYINICVCVYVNCSINIKQMKKPAEGR